MPIIAPSDLSTHLYAEIITEITRGDATITTTAIDTAVQEAKMYLAKYDLVQLFGTTSASPTFTDGYLSNLVKDLATWHLLRLANPGVDNATARTAYEDALGVLKSIMTGQVQPAGWPYINTLGETTAEGDSIKWSSMHKRHNYY